MLKKNKVTKREITLFLAFLCVYTILFADKFIQRAYANLKKLENTIASKEKTLSFYTTFLKNSTELDSQYSAIFSGSALAEDFDSLLQEINAFAQRYNVNILNIKPTLLTEEKKYKTYVIRIEGQDDVAAVSRFLYYLTKRHKNIGIERIQIKAQKKEELPRISIALNAVTFKR
jgi:uncharacterized protein with ACT and thioredoxin-like domain